VGAAAAALRPAVGGADGSSCMRSLSPCCLLLSLPRTQPAARGHSALHLHRAAHEVVQTRVQRLHFGRWQHAVDDEEAVALKRLPLQI
jgi:hypothetical protein